MNKNVLRLVLSFAIVFAAVFVNDFSPTSAQTDFPDGTYLFGTIENDVISGYFSRNHGNPTKSSCVFVGSNGKVYKMSLIERNVHELYIDGQKIPDSEISKHNAEYKSFLEKYLRAQEIEK